MPSYPVLEIEGSDSELELALAFLMDRGCLGLEEDPSGAALRAFFPDGTALECLVTEMGSLLPGLEVRPAVPEPDRDWLEEWKKSFSGFALGETAFVLPTWKPSPEVTRSVLRLDPEQAFGTGTHDTTRLAVELLERFLRQGDSVIDLGTGTGILAMIAARRGAARVLALDHDPDAVRCARENVARNSLVGAVEVAHGGFEDLDCLDADILVANITAPVLARAVERMRARAIILSGLLADEVDEFAGELPAGLVVRELWSAGEWSALVLQEA